MHITVNDVACLITAKFSLLKMPYLRPKSRLPRRWSHWSVYRMQLLQSYVERRLPITRHRARWMRLAHRGAARVAFLVGLVVGICSRMSMYGGSCRGSWNQEANGPLAKHLSTLSRLHATPPCVISITTLPPNDLCIPALLSVSAAVSQRVGLEK